MLVASSPTVWFQLAWDKSLREDLRDRYACRPGRSVSARRPSGPAKLRPQQWKPAMGPVRRVVGVREPFPSAWRFQPIAALRQIRLSFGITPFGKLRCRAFRSCRPSCRSRPSVAPSGPRRFGQRLRATHCICGSPGSFRRTPEARFPTLLRASLPLRSG